ncbi:MAG: hypothetical protein KF819_11585 [Labilithrix sp.]|nr:hypothetical protein [Labilithrix sp.]
MRWLSIVAGGALAAWAVGCTLLVNTGDLSSPSAEADAAPVPSDSGRADASNDVSSDVIPTIACEAVTTPGRLAQEASGTNGWDDENGALGPGGGRAHSNGSDSPLILRNFGFEIPATARIQGIRVDISRAACERSFDKSITLTRGSGTFGPSRAVTDRELPRGCFDFEDAQYGGPTDLWDESWTPADLNAPTFGVAMTFESPDAHVDRVQVTVSYCP